MTWNTPQIETVANARGELLRVLNVHNRHAGQGGFEVFYQGVTNVLRERGHHVSTHERDSSQIVTIGQKLSAFQTAIASPRARRNMTAMVERDAIDLVHLNNVWPLVSPSVVDGCRDAYGGRGVPVVMSVQDYKLTCPAGQHLRDGHVCTECLGGREHRAIVHGCRNGRVWSTAYALRNVVARKRQTFERGVTLFLPCSNFVGEHLIAAGYDARQIHVLPNFTDLPDVAIDHDRKGEGAYACFVGRVSPEKGVATMMEAARTAGISLKIAGDWSEMPELREGAPPNVEFVGRLSRGALPDFYRGARFSVVPSEWLEAFGIVAAEAQGYGTPVVVTDVGGLRETIVDGETGLLVPPRNAMAMATAFRRLWDDPALVARLSRAGRARAVAEFTPSVFYRRLAAAYQHAIDLHEGHHA